MAHKSIVVCDVCGVTKGKTNHWWKAWVEDGVFHTCPADKEIYFPEGTGDGIAIKDVCGQGDALNLFSDFLGIAHSIPDQPTIRLKTEDDIPF